jgi:hypothetical protein
VNNYSLIGVLIALIGVLKGKEVWEYLKSRNDSKGNKDLIKLYETQLNECKERSDELIKKNEALSERLQKHLLKSKGNGLKQNKRD